MTPQEEQALVQIIVQCVRAVLNASSTGASLETAGEGSEKGANQLSQPSFTARFVDVAPTTETFKASPAGGQQNGGPVRLSSRNREDVRETLQRFLRSSEQLTPGVKAAEKIATSNRQPGNQGRASSTRGPATLPAAEPQPQKRQLITQADILAAVQQGQKVIALQPDAIVTPLARQVAKEKGIELR